MAKHNLIASLDSLIEDVRSLSQEYAGNLQAIPEDEINALYQRFHVLHGRFAKLGDDFIGELDPLRQHVLRYLGMGKSSQEQFLRPFINGLAEAKDTNQASIFMAEIVKTHECRRMLRSRRFDEVSAEDQEQLKEFLGGLLGVQITDSFIQSIRHEMVGDVLAYAIAGLSEVHVKEYESSKGLKSAHPTVQDYLLYRIRTDAMDIRYEYSVENGAVYTSLLENSTRPLVDRIERLEKSSSKRGVASGKFVDNAYVNHATKTIVMCAATARGSVSGLEQATSLAKAKEALINWLDSEDCPWEGKDEYKKNIQTVILNGGLMPTNNPQGAGPSKSYEGKVLIDAMGGDRWDGEFQSRVWEAIGNTSYLSYFADRAADPMVAALLFHSNYFSVGSDTHRIWHEMGELRKTSNGPYEDRQYPVYILGKLLDTLKVLNDPQVELHLAEGKGRSAMMEIVESCASCLNRHFLNFPFGQVDEQERRLLMEAGSQLEKVAEKLLETNGLRLNSALIADASSTGERFASPSMLEKMIHKKDSYAAHLPHSSQHSYEMQGKMSGALTGNRRQEMKEIVHDLIEDRMRHGDVEFLEVVFEHLQKIEPLSQSAQNFCFTAWKLAFESSGAKAYWSWSVPRERHERVVNSVLEEGGYANKKSFGVMKSHFAKMASWSAPDTLRLLEAMWPLTRRTVGHEQFDKATNALSEFVLDLIGNRKNHPLLTRLRDEYGADWGQKHRQCARAEDKRASRRMKA